MAEPIFVKSITGLYDERSEAITKNIRDRRFCWHHKFVNANLHWAKPPRPDEKHCGWYVDLSSPGEPNFNTEWGKGYGAIRYCIRCKHIDCIHLWDISQSKNYCIGEKFYYTSYVIETCRICRRRILLFACGVYKPSDRAWQIINEEHKKLLGKDFDSLYYGSGYSAELPVHVSEVLDSLGEDAAREAVRQAFINEDISYLARKEGE